MPEKPRILTSTVSALIPLAHDDHWYSKPRIIQTAHRGAKETPKIRIECIANFPSYCLKSNYVATENKAKTRAVIECNVVGPKRKTETQAQ